MVSGELSTYERAVVGLDGNVNSLAEVAALEQELATKGNIGSANRCRPYG